MGYGIIRHAFNRVGGSGSQIQEGETTHKLRKVKKFPVLCWMLFFGTPLASRRPMNKKIFSCKFFSFSGISTTWIQFQNPDSPTKTLFGVGWIRMTSRKVEELRFFPFATGINDNGGAPSAANIIANFCIQIRNGPNGILGGFGETDS
jgi:hypothetical protein